MNNLKRMILVCVAVCLVFPAYVAGKEVIEDPEPVNFDYAMVFPDYTLGDYLCFLAHINLNGDLQKFGDVVNMKATHIENDWEVNLIRKNRSCVIRVLPEDWMYTGTWQFTLKYEDSKGKEHDQIAYYEMGEVAFPPPPFHIRIWLKDDFYKVSWSGIGDPKEDKFDYCVRVFEENWSKILGTFCCTEDGVYDPDLNKVTVDVPADWRGYLIRIENKLLSPRGSEPYGQYNRAKTHDRLLPKSLDYD